MPALTATQVADLLVVLGAIARLVDEPGLHPHDQLGQIRGALAVIGITSDQTRAERLTSIRRALRRSGRVGAPPTSPTRGLPRRSVWRAEIAGDRRRRPEPEETLDP